MDYELLGKRIKELCKSRGLTQEQLAEMANISFAFLGHIERGTRKLSVQTLLSIARALECSTDYLLDNVHGKSHSYLHALQRVADFIQKEIQSHSY